ncbi:MAG: histidinol-phosphatase HisJ family protein [Vallitaleaceae bacterium]|nr:histidinol-phosphatase HisJ family protein [Vallitaleaceae bacterium]
MLADYHLHSNFSGDCKIPMEEMILAAIQLGVHRLCFTEHHDLDFPHPSIDFTISVKDYLQRLFELKDKYSDRIQVLAGVELGMQPHLHATLSKIVQENPFDFILASNHLAKGIDPYDKIYFENRSQYKGYLDYFEDILKNVQGFSDFDSYGHLDYVIRYGDFPQKSYVYKDFKEVLDEVLKTIIEKGKGIEVNTSGYRYNLGNPHPSEEILRHYYELGGRILTLGSDAHHPNHITNNFEKARSLLKEIGFKEFTTFIHRKPEFHSL